TPPQLFVVPTAHYNLGFALLQQGRFAEARTATQKALQLLPKGHPWRQLFTNQLGRCDQFLKLETKLPSALQGKEQPAAAAEQLALAELCKMYKNLYAAAARFYAAAFAQQPKLADTLRSHRYNAACAAACAAACKGVDAAKLPGQECARLRRQA